jgi:ubiquinone/menaquinone biosynthesis C-methylase UbiE
MPKPTYVLGHSAFELERLARQERLIGGATRDYFRSAGLAAGMRVLDVGSGGGATAMHAADLVGPAGQVIGTDLSPAAVAAASEAAASRGLRHVSFRQGDPAEMTFERPFDAVVGRYVLLFQSDQAGMLRRLAKLVRPGGLVIFHEPDWSFVRSDPPAPAYDQACRWIVDTFERLGQSTNMQAKLRRAFLDAGLGAPTMRMRAVVGDAVTALDWLHAVADLISVIAPAVQQQGLATRAEIGVETLAARIAAEVAANSSIVVGRAEIGAWVRV